MKMCFPFLYRTIQRETECCLGGTNRVIVSSNQAAQAG